MASQALTERQAQVLGFLRDYSLRNGMPPTIKEVARNLNLSTDRGAEKHLKSLAQKGLLVHAPRTSRAYRLPPEESPPVVANTNTTRPPESQFFSVPFHHGQSIRAETAVPIRGRVPGGSPSEQPDEDLGSIRVPLRLSDEAFAVRVYGESMRDAHIVDGDIAVGDPSVEPVDGTVVIALVDGGLTIKTLRRTTAGWWLEAANDQFQPILPKVEGDRVEATVVALYRGRLGKRPPSGPW